MYLQFEIKTNKIVFSIILSLNISVQAQAQAQTLEKHKNKLIQTSRNFNAWYTH